jgi:hypothetical protein
MKPVVYANGGRVVVMHPNWDWVNRGVDAVDDVPPYEDANPVENMNDTGSYGFFTSTIVGVAQSFTAHKGGILSSAKVWARQNLANPDQLPLTAAIYDTTSPVGTAMPEGAPLAISEPIDSGGLAVSPDIQPVEFLFTGANQIQFELNKVYCLALERPAESADVIRFGFHAGLQKHDGIFTEHRPTGWQGGIGMDLIFYVYGDGEPPPPEPEPFESWPVENQNDIGSYGIRDVLTGPFQAFTAPRNVLLKTVKVSLKKMGSPVGNLVVAIRDGVGEYPAVTPGGRIIGSRQVDVSTVSADENGALQTFEFLAPVSLVGGQKYCLVIEKVSDGGGTTFTSPDYLNVGFTFTFDATPQHYGNGGFNQGGWTPDDASDMIFYLYE